MSTPAQPSSDRPRRRWLSKGVMWFLNAVLGLTTVTVLGIGAGVFYLASRPVTAPDWAQSRIEARIAEVLPQARVSFGEMAFVMEESWTPRVRLRNVVVRAVSGEELVRLSEFKATLSGTALLEGQFRPRDLSLSGMVARIRRAADGSVAVQAGFDGLAAEREAATLPELIGQVDAVLLSPALASLREVDLRALTLRYEDVRTERVWTMDGGRLNLTREAGALTLLADLAVLDGSVGVSTLSANYTSRIGEVAAEFGVAFDDVAAQDIAAQGPAFAWLGVLQAPISGSVRGGLQSDGTLSPLAATLQIGRGVVRPNAATEPIPFDRARSYFSYNPTTRVLAFDELSVRSAWFTGVATGSAALGLDETGSTLRDLVGQIQLSNLSANPRALYEAPVSLGGAEVDFRLELDPFRLTLGRGQITDLGQTALLDGIVAADADGWRLALDARMDAISPDRLLTLWPEAAAGNTRRWLVENLQAGQIRNIDLALRRSADAPPQTYLAFEYDKARVRFARTLPPIHDGQGHFTLLGSRMGIALDAGHVTPPQGGEIDMSGSTFVIPDLRIKNGTPAQVQLVTRSSVTAALSLLNMPPLSMMDKINLPEDLAQGRAELTGTLDLNLQRGQPPKVNYDVQGDLIALRTDSLVKGRVIASDRLRIETDNSNLQVTGVGTLDGVPFDATYRQPIGKGAGPGSLRADVEVTPRALDAFGIALPPGSISGTGRGTAEVTIARGQPAQLAFSSDLAGLRIAVPQVSWVKPPAQRGSLSLRATLGQVPQVDRIALSAPGLEAEGAIRFNEDATLERVRFDRINVGNWLDLPLDLLGRGKGRPLAVVLRGGTLDLRRASFGNTPPDPAAPPMQVRLDRLQITDTIALTGLEGTFETAKGLDGAFTARMNDAAPVQGRLAPQQGRSAVRMTSADAGGVLRAAGLLKQVAGGNLSLVLLPVGSGGAFDGALEVTDVAIKDAPGIAALLNAVSVVGLVNELNGDGIFFDDVEARFRLTPNRLTLTEGSAVGASMGLSMDGTYALDTGQLAMQGVISPVYLLNGIGSLFTRKGEGLIGFNYALSGQAKEPKVSVNPLSALTPAMFREIFRAPPPELPAVEGVTESTLPAPQSRPQRPVARRFEGR